MKVSRAQVELNRERILDTAAELFRERGFDGIGLNDLMQAAGLTRGGFYGHFESKEDLAAQASRRALETTRDHWGAGAEPGTAALTGWIKAYLSQAHCDRLGEGCAFAALAGDAARAGPAVKQAFADGVEDVVAALLPQLPEAEPAARRRHALALLSTLVGALVLARAVGQPALARELRQATRESALSSLV